MDPTDFIWDKKYGKGAHLTDGQILALLIQKRSFLQERCYETTVEEY